MRSFVVAIALGCSAAPHASHAQDIVLPAEVVDGDPVPVRVAGLPADATVTIAAFRVPQSGPATTSRADYVSDASGAIDPATSAAVGGDYRGRDAAGLFWSMRAVGRDAAPPAVGERGTLRLTASIDGRVVASRSVRLVDPASRAVMTDVPRFVGARLYRPVGRPARGRRLPVIVLLGGSEGGSGYGREMGPRLAALGYAALALPYHNPAWTGEVLPGLPDAFADIPVDRLEDVRRWIAATDGLDARRIAVMGGSKGGEFAMLAAARFAWLRAAVGIVPSDVVWEGWGRPAPENSLSSFAWRGKPLPFTPYHDIAPTIAALSRGEPASLAAAHLDGRRRNPAAAARARIPVERFRGAMLVAGGDDDRTWPSGEMVRAIAERRAAAGLPTVALTFAGAGHGLSGNGWEPMNYPGNTSLVADAAARAAIWGALVPFLDEALRR